MNKLVAAIALLIVAAACSYANGVLELDGKPFPAEKAPLVHEGMTTSEVRTILGDPLERSGHVGSESWRYYYRQQQRATTRILGLFPVTTLGQTWSREIVVVFRQGIVEAIKTEAGT